MQEALSGFVSREPVRTWALVAAFLVVAGFLIGGAPLLAALAPCVAILASAEKARSKVEPVEPDISHVERLPRDATPWTKHTHLADPEDRVR